MDVIKEPTEVNNGYASPNQKTEPSLKGEINKYQLR